MHPRRMPVPPGSRMTPPGKARLIKHENELWKDVQRKVKAK